MPLAGFSCRKNSSYSAVCIYHINYKIFYIFFEFLTNVSCRRHYYYKFPGTWVVGYFWFDFFFFVMNLTVHFWLIFFLFKLCNSTVVLLSMTVRKLLICLCLQLRKSVVGTSLPAIQCLMVCPYLQLLLCLWSARANVAKAWEDLWSTIPKGAWQVSFSTVWVIKCFLWSCWLELDFNMGLRLELIPLDLYEMYLLQSCWATLQPLSCS